MTTPPIQLQDNLSIRPARANDQAFLTKLHHSSRDDLRLLDAEADFIEALITLQQRAQNEGYGHDFPNALYFVVEKLGERIGRIVIDFGAQEVRLIDILFIPAARGQGYGASVIRSLQHAAAQVHTPLTLSAMHSSPQVLQWYLNLGFKIVATQATHSALTWYPPGLSPNHTAITH